MGLKKVGTFLWNTLYIEINTGHIKRKSIKIGGYVSPCKSITHPHHWELLIRTVPVNNLFLHLSLQADEGEMEDLLAVERDKRKTLILQVLKRSGPSAKKTPESLVDIPRSKDKKKVKKVKYTSQLSSLCCMHPYNKSYYWESTISTYYKNT